MILFIAEQFAHARGAAERIGLPRNAWRFVNEPERMRGMRGAIVFVVDTAARRTDYRELMEMCAVFECVVWSETDYARRG